MSLDKKFGSLFIGMGGMAANVFVSFCVLTLGAAMESEMHASRCVHGIGFERAWRIAAVLFLVENVAVAFAVVLALSGYLSKALAFKSALFALAALVIFTFWLWWNPVIC